MTGFDKKKAKLERWCAFQERCISETRLYCYKNGFTDAETNELIAGLLRDNFINEARFSGMFALGKFHNNKWGRLRIAAELQARHIPVELIAAGLAGIDETEYENSIRTLIPDLKEQVETENGLIRHLMAKQAIAKGFEPERVFAVIDTLLKKKG